ncbi:MAG: dimethyl sulfoxide reductase anchor subunit, partial [Thermoanaerobaculia bacterium]|nr:dimethyl sulfoxide reductase anchor subunit [Thermoanaerobaculia bacterium]
IIFITACLAMAGSHFHLSKPLHSYQAVLNFRTSWLSREIVFTVFFFLTLLSLLALHWLQNDKTKLKTLLGWIAVLFGFALVFCMAHIYLLPAQPAWNSPFTILSFFLTMLLLGNIALPAMLLVDFSFSNVLTLERFDQQYLLIRRVLIWSTTAGALIWLMAVALNFYQTLMLRLGDRWTQTSFELLTNLYRPLLVLRLALPLLGIAILAISVFSAVRRNRAIQELMVPIYASCIFVIVGEILGRFLFYATHIRIGV